MNHRGEGTYLLPTEAEWEYAARAGSTTAFANGGIIEMYCKNDPNLSVMGWYCGNSDDKIHPVAEKQANAYGLYDMHGNVWERCQYRYGNDPMGSNSGSYRVIRGGGSDGDARYCRSANRSKGWYSSSNIGFRLILSAGQQR